MNTPKMINVLGAGGHSAEVIEAAELIGWTVVGLYDDDIKAHGRKVMGLQCAGTIQDFLKGPKSIYILAIGSNEVRMRVSEALTAEGHVAARVVHPSVAMSRTAEVGPGSYIGACTFVGPQARVGAHAIIGAGVCLGHDSVVGDFAQVCPGAKISGFGALGTGAFMGSNAVAGPGVLLGEWARLGANSFAKGDVAARALAVGVPAKVKNHNAPK